MRQRNVASYHLLTQLRLFVVGGALVCSSCSSDGGTVHADSSTSPDAVVIPEKRVCAGPMCKTKADCPSGYKGCVKGKCVKCLSDADCAKPFPYCSKSNLCVECTKDEHCKLGPKKCTDRVIEGMCEECETDADCPTGLGCEDFMRRCLTCKTDADCQGVNPIANFNLYGKLCRDVKSLGIRACVRCTKDADCAKARFKGCKIFAANVGSCTKCTSNEECCQGKANCGLICDTDGDCVCATSQQCTTTFPGTWTCEE